MPMMRATSWRRRTVRARDSDRRPSTSASTCFCFGLPAAVREIDPARQTDVSVAVGDAQLFPALVSATDHPVIEQAPHLVRAGEVNCLCPTGRSVAADPLNHQVSPAARRDLSLEIESMRTIAIP